MTHVLVVVTIVLLSACAPAQDATQVPGGSLTGGAAASPSASTTGEHGTAGQLSIQLAPQVGGQHLAALERVAGQHTVLASGDRDLRSAASALGFAVADTARNDR